MLQGSMSIHDELVRVRQQRLERARLGERIADARRDRDHVAEQLAAARAAQGYREQAGAAGWLRRLVAQVPDLSDAQQELSAAALLSKELEDELSACEAYQRQLGERTATLGDVDARHAQLLATLEREARANGILVEELDELAITQAELGASRFELREAITLALDLQQTFTRVIGLVRDLNPMMRHDDGPDLWTGLGQALTGSASANYRTLCVELAHAHQGVRAFDQLGSRLRALQPGSLRLEVAPLPSEAGFVFRSLVAATGFLEPILPELARVSSELVATVGELRTREAKLDRAIAECDEMRARMLERYLHAR
jgi:hypothetical protein